MEELKEKVNEDMAIKIDEIGYLKTELIERDTMMNKMKVEVKEKRAKNNKEIKHLKTELVQLDKIID